MSAKFNLIKKTSALCLAVILLAGTAYAFEPTGARTVSVSETSSIRPLIAPVAISPPVSSGWTNIQIHEPRSFDCPIDQIYYNQFGENFALLQQRSTPVNQTITYGNFTVEVLSSVAIASNPTPSLIVNRATGRTSYDWENTTTELEAFTFFSIRDRAGRVNFSQGIMLEREFIPTAWEPTQQVTLWASSPMFLHEHQGRGYFVVVHRGTALGAVDNISLDFGINYIVGDIQLDVTQLDIDFADILQNHTATFNRRANDMFGFHIADRVLLDPISPPPPRGWYEREIPRYIYVTERGQLSIPLYGGRYLTNLAIRDGHLHVQTSEPDWELDWDHAVSSRWTPLRWMESVHVRLLDTRINWEAFNYPSTLTPEEFETTMQELAELQQEFMMVNSADLSIVNMTTGRTVDGRRYTEAIYQIANQDVLRYLQFSVHSTTVGVNETVDLTVAPFNVPVISQHRQIEGGAEITLANGEAVTINSIMLTPIGMTISVDMPQDERFHFHYHNAFEVYFIDTNGNETPFTWRSTSTLIEHGHTSGMWGAIADRLPMFGSDTMRARVTLSGNVIDLENIAHVQINGVVF